MKRIFVALFCLIVCTFSSTAQQWTKKDAINWYGKQAWIVGADFLPSTAINQLEMWQEKTFDPVTIDRELGWAEKIGMNAMRVYLHDLAWKQDPQGFKTRMNTYLGIAASHHIKTIFCIFDDCWNPEPVIGTQPEPKPGVHNSGWVRSPSQTVHNDSTQWGYLQKYVTDIISSFKNDKRILIWDLYNEPGNSGYGMSSMPLLEDVFAWAQAVRPDQPLSAGVWFMDFPALNQFQLQHSDVTTFHNYNDTVSLKIAIDSLKKYGRPLVCTEYMARTNNSRFQTHLPVFKRYKVGALNWGLVSGKSNTIYAWNTPIPSGAEPPVWFHDIFRKNGKPYDPAEVKAIKTLTQR